MPVTAPCPRCRLAPLAISFLILAPLLGATASIAFTDISVATNPAQPTLDTPVELLLRFTAPQGLDVTSTTLQDFHFTIELELVPCLITCPPFEHELPVDLGFLATGNYSVTFLLDGDIFANHQFVVAATTASLAPQLAIDPPLPNDNDFVTLSLSMLVEECAEPPPILRSVIQTSEGTLEVTLERAISGPPCTPGPPSLHSVVVPIGQRAAGEYTVNVSIETIALPQPPESRAVAEQGVLEPLGSFDLSIADGGPAALQADRFEIEIEYWTTDPTDTRPAKVVGLPRLALERPQAALFSFFMPDNWEVLVKVLDGCQINGRYWVYLASATDVGYRVAVRDRVTDESWTFENELGTRSPAVTDVEAFAGCAVP